MSLWASDRGVLRIAAISESESSSSRQIDQNFLGVSVVAYLPLVDEIETVAAAKSCTSAQVALAWVIGRDEHVLTIPGTTKLENLKSNLGAYDVVLSADEQTTLDTLADRVLGDRYDEGGMSVING